MNAPLMAVPSASPWPPMAAVLVVDDVGDAIWRITGAGAL